MTLVIVGHGPGAALLHRQAGLGAVERLDLRLLVERQYHRMGWRIDIEADDLGELLGEGRVVRQLEAAPAMWTEAVRLPDRLHRRGRNADRLRHRANRPVGCFVRRRFLRQADDLGDALWRDRRLAGRTGFVAKQTIDPFVHEALLPAPNAGLGFTGLGHDRRGAQTIVAQQNDACPPDVLLRAPGGRCNGAQPQTVGGG